MSFVLIWRISFIDFDILYGSYAVYVCVHAYTYDNSLVVCVCVCVCALEL